MGKIDDLFFGQISLTSSAISSIIDIGLLPNYDRLRDDFPTLQEELERDFNELFSPKLHEKYFMYNEGNKYPKVGYFIGVHYIIPLLEAGYSLNELTRSKTKDILYKYSEMKSLL